MFATQIGFKESTGYITMYGGPDADAYDDIEEDTAYYAQCLFGYLWQLPDKGRL